MTRKKRILIYSPTNYRNVELQSQGEVLIKIGYEVYFLSWMENGPLHENFRELGAKAFSADSIKGRNIFFLINHARYLKKFCSQYQIDICISHSQANAFVSGLANPFTKTRFFYFRHNSDYYELYMKAKYQGVNRWANRLSKHIIAPSRKVKEQLMKEGVPEAKIYRINNCYNFSRYWKDSQDASVAIREQYKAELLLLSVARLEPLKRQNLSFEIVKKLNELGVNCKLVSIGSGSKKVELEQWIAENKMTGKIFLEPFRTNAIDYFQACDLLIHLSNSEASSNVTKEAAMCDKTVVVCHDVGDFDDYMENGVNAFLVDKENPIEEAVKALYENYKDKQLLTRMGKALHERINTLFSMEAVEEKYQNMLSSNGD